MPASTGLSIASVSSPQLFSLNPRVAYSAGSFTSGYLYAFIKSSVDNNIYSLVFAPTGTGTSASSMSFPTGSGASNYTLSGPTPLPGSGENIVALNGNSLQAEPFAGLPLGTSWSSKVAYSNVTITALLGNFQRTTYSGTAWLLSKIGTGSDPSSVIATAPFTVSVVGSDIYSYVTLFSNLQLPAGTFYLILNTPTGLSDSASWRAISSGGTIESGTDVSYGGTWAGSSPLNSFPPAGSFGGPFQQGFIFNVRGTAVAGPVVNPKGVVPIYNTSNVIQSGSWISIFGSNLSPQALTWNGDFPTNLGGTTVTINSKPAYLWFVSPSQINLQAPDDTATGPVNVIVSSPTGTVTSTATLGQASPSLSLLDGKHVAGIILRSDNSGTQGAYDIVGPSGNSLGYATVAAKAGDILVIFGVGFGPTNPPVPAGAVFSGAASTSNPVQVFINNVAVTPSFSGITSAGLYQINLQIPSGLGAGDVPLTATVNGLQTQPGVVLSLQ
jgi:uncharacterized protein (TIGR03437 family)